MSRAYGSNVALPNSRPGQELAITQRVPDEILREIFIQSLPDKATFVTSEAPPPLCHVCGHWRSLAMDYASLWSTLKLVIDESNPRVALREELSTTWFKRWTPASKISFKLILRGLLHPIVIAESSYRFAYKSQALPSYHFRIYEGIGNPNWQGGLIRAFEQCPLLKRVALAGQELEYPQEIVAIPWNQLPHFCYHDEISPYAFSQCISEMAKLVHIYFCLNNETSGNNDLPFATSTVLRELASLTLNYSGLADTHVDDNSKAYWITMCGDGECRILDNQQLFLMKLRSMKRLEKLSLCLETLDFTTCGMLFQCCPNVTHLDLETSKDQYQAVLTALHGSKGYLPRLKTLVLEVGNGSAFKQLRSSSLEDDEVIRVDALLSLIESRQSCEPEAQLQRIVFYAGEAQQGKDAKAFYRCLEPYIGKGLIVERKVEKDFRNDGCEAFGFQRDEQFPDWREAAEIFRDYQGRGLRRGVARIDDGLVVERRVGGRFRLDEVADL
ncbi:hypothetical protein BKA70DRAFT_1214914 [Coprinopsis sp. MPI-PUGE-AT-0042]|nr:hypothetical protein BKA70DRAFT_1214914 [Coprinopsis sp. MPI-PUGE-AT-0042]